MRNNIRKNRYREHWQLYVFLILPLIYIIIFAYIPMIGVHLAFRKYDLRYGVWQSPWIGFNNFRKFLTSYQFERVLLNTIRLSFYSIIASFPFPIIFALFLNTVNRLYFKKVVQTITYMPHFISIVVIVGMMLQIFHPMNGLYGVITRLITGETPRDLFASTKAFPHLYIWSGIWQNFGWGSIIYLAALSSVSHELHEAAEVDGASRFKRILHIDLPAILPTITILLILRTGSIMTIGFEKAYLMQNDLNLRVSEIISTYVYKQGLGSGASSDYSYATAIGLFNSAINFVILVMVNKISRKVSETSLW